MREGGGITPPGLMSRRRVADALRLHDINMTYALFPAYAAIGGSIPTAAVVGLLNQCGVGMPSVHEIPRLVTEDELAEGVEYDGEPMTVQRVRSLCRRRVYPIPHYRITRNTLRFTPGVLDWWRSFLNTGVYVDWRRYSIGAAPYAGESVALFNPRKTRAKVG